MRHLSLAAIALAAMTSGSATLMLTGPAEAAPSCQFGFQTDLNKNWILKCSKIAPMSQKGALLTQANNANCNTDSYWNYGPQVTAQHLRRNTMVKVGYTCGHVEG